MIEEGLRPHAIGLRDECNGSRWRSVAVESKVAKLVLDIRAFWDVPPGAGGRAGGGGRALKGAGGGGGGATTSTTPNTPTIGRR